MAGVETIRIDQPNNPASSANIIVTIKRVFRSDNNIRYSFFPFLLARSYAALPLEATIDFP
jgi:hypothetical protein